MLASSKCEQFFFVKNQKYECGRRLEIKIRILFYAENSRTVALIVRQIKFGTVKDHWHIPASFIWTVILSDEAFKYDDGLKFWAYVGTNAELLCMELCNFCNAIYL
jgi:hypothetical protein